MVSEVSGGRAGALRIRTRLSVNASRSGSRRRGRCGVGGKLALVERLDGRGHAVLVDELRLAYDQRLK